MLSLITFLPAVAALVLALFLRGNDAAAGRNAKWVALVATLATFVSSGCCLTFFRMSFQLRKSRSRFSFGPSFLVRKRMSPGEMLLEPRLWARKAAFRTCGRGRTIG